MIAKKKRYWELDFMRGICVILMVFDHAMFSFGDVLPAICDILNVEFLKNMPDFAYEYWMWDFRQVFRIFVFTAFFVICGISCTFSHSNIKRGLKALGVAVAITFVTATIDKFIDAGMTIRFGVIHMLAFAMLFYGLIDLLGALIEKIKKNNFTLWVRRLLPGAVGIILLILYLLLWGELNFSGEYIGFHCTLTINSDNKLLGDILFAIMEVSGIDGFNSADYFPLLPYAAIVLIGSLFGWIIYHTCANNYLTRLDGYWNKGVCFVGRHALIVYVAHQVVIAIVLFIIGVFAKIFLG